MTTARPAAVKFPVFDSAIAVFQMCVFGAFASTSMLKTNNPKA
jgi:hypothetical protein